MAKRRRATRTFPPFLAVSLLAIGALIILRAAVAVAYADRIYPGVSVGGVDLGGASVADAQVRLNQAFGAYDNQTLALQAGDQSFKMTPKSLGFHPQSGALVQAAYQVGRDGGVGGLILGPLAAHTASLGIDPALLVDSNVLDSAMSGLANRVNRSPKNASLNVGDQVTFSPSLDGQQLDPVAAKDTILGTLLGMETGPVVLPVRRLPPEVTTAELSPIKAQAEEVLGRSIALSNGQQTWPIPTAELRAAIVVRSSPAGLDLNPAPFEATVRAAAKSIDQAPRDATLTVENGKVVVQPEATGQVVDVSATLTALHDKILAGQSTVPIVVKTASSTVTASDLAPLAAQAQKQIDAGLVLTAEGQNFTISSADLGPMVIVATSSGQPRLSLDPAKLSARIAQIDGQFRHPSLDARLGWSNGHVVISSSTVPGVAIDQAAAVTAVLAGWDKGTVALPTVNETIPVDDALVARLNADLRQVIGTRQTSFAGSIPERAHNIDLAMSKINGTYVAPGEIFSFNRAVGPTTLAAGFQWGFGFSTGKDGSKVVPSVAGGICQVATTVFQPVFWAGYEIEERHWHMFPMSTYRDNGYWGLDATVDSGSNLDMQFLNDTGHGLLILSGTTSDRRAIVTLVSTPPDWTVKVTPEQLTNVTPPPKGVVTENSPLFQKGRTILLEDAQQGFVSQLTRTVTYPDGHVRTLKMQSTYQPSQESILVGTG